MLLDVYAVVAGIAYAVLLLYFPWRRVFRRQAGPNAPERLLELQRRWNSLGRRRRRSIAKVILAGRAVPVEYASMVIHTIDVQNEALKRRLPTQRRRLFRTYVNFGVTVALGVYLIVLRAGPVGRFLGVALISFACAVIGRMTWRFAIQQRRLRAWYENSARTREQAVRDLAALETVEPR